MKYKNLSDQEIILLQQEKLVCGVDEAGRGPLAGPVTAACVCLPREFFNQDINDSKKLTDKKRRELFPIIIDNAIAYSIISVGSRRIDEINILKATKLAMRLTAQKVHLALLKKKINEQIIYLIDGNVKLESELPNEAIIKGDARVLAISAASILAKVTRDDLMEKLAERYPRYEFSKHKGYGTELHRKAIANFGPSPVHRKTFGGVSEFL